MPITEVNDAIDTIEAFNTFGIYPFATTIHIAVGMIAGWFLLSGKELSKWGVNGSSSSLLGMTILFCWIAYEVAEFSRIHDQVDKDIANGILGLFLGLLVGKLIWHYGLLEIEQVEGDEEKEGDST